MELAPSEGSVPSCSVTMSQHGHDCTSHDWTVMTGYSHDSAVMTNCLYFNPVNDTSRVLSFFRILFLADEGRETHQPETANMARTSQTRKVRIPLNPDKKTKRDNEPLNPAPDKKTKRDNEPLTPAKAPNTLVAPAGPEHTQVISLSPAGPEDVQEQSDDDTPIGLLHKEGRLSKRGACKLCFFKCLKEGEEMDETKVGDGYYNHRGFKYQRSLGHECSDECFKQCLYCGVCEKQ